MNARHIVARQLALLALIMALAITTSAPPASAADPSPYRDCYRSLRKCQKSRCAQIDGSEQVKCIRQCNREYETCVSGAGGTGSIRNIPDKLTTPTSKKRKREIQRAPTP
jgi:hypothetical protein